MIFPNGFFIAWLDKIREQVYNRDSTLSVREIKNSIYKENMHNED